MLLVPSLAPSTAAAQRRKDPGVASLWAVFVPGAGHLYAGERGKGIAMLAASATAFGVAVAQWDRTTEHVATYPYPPGSPVPTYSDTTRVRDRTPAYVAAGVGAAVWLYSLVDAGNAVERANRRVALLVAPGRVGVSLSHRSHR